MRTRVKDLREQLAEEREARRRADMIIAQLARANEEQARTIRALEAPSELPSDDRGSPETAEEELGSAENSRNASSREPQDTVFITLVPLPREQTGANSRSLLFRRWMRSPSARYLSYAIGIILTAASAGLDFFYSPEGVDISVRLFIAAAFGIYVGIKDGKKGQPVGRFNIIGSLAGLLAWMVAAYVSKATLLAAYDRGDISPIVSSVFTYFLGTWLIFMSGFLIGKAVQIKAEEDRGRPQEALAKGTRTTAIVGLVGVIVAALLQVIGQMVSALVGNSGP